MQKQPWMPHYTFIISTRLEALIQSDPSFWVCQVNLSFCCICLHLSSFLTILKVPSWLHYRHLRILSRLFVYCWILTSPHQLGCRISDCSGQCFIICHFIVWLKATDKVNKAKSETRLSAFLSVLCLPCPLGAFIPGVPVQPVLMRYPNSLVSDDDCNAQFMLAERTENILLAQRKWANSTNCLFVPILEIKGLDFIVHS